MGDQSTTPQSANAGSHGPRCWALCLAVGLAVGALWAWLVPTAARASTGLAEIRLWLVVPFALLLLSIALMPFLRPRLWERHYPDFACFLGGTMIAYYLVGLRALPIKEDMAGAGRMGEVALDYVKFIALIGSLYVVSGGVLIDIRGRVTPLVNTALLAAGAVLANLFGTTGASVLLIRPFIRVNKHRIRPFHVIMFIFIVSNTAGCLTPIGDPPLFLGYLKGVPFSWPLIHCLPAWLVCLGLLLGLFFVLDTLSYRSRGPGTGDRGQEGATSGAGWERGSAERLSVSLSGWLSFLFLGIVLFGVFLDTLLEQYLQVRSHFPFGAAVQVAAAAAAYKCARPENLQANEFTFNPIKEVALLFFGIFATMVPALDYLEHNAASLQVVSPTAFYWASGSLSSVLDNAPTYLTFLSAAHGLAVPPLPVGMEHTPEWLRLAVVGETGVSAEKILLAISLGSVFFGANTYIGNGPNFMVKAISEAAGVRMPTFFGYIVKYTLPILLPVFAVIWWLFIR